MSEMVERVARAMVRAGVGELDFDQWTEEMQALFLRQAEAAIKAMREPTDAMLEQGPPEPYMDVPVWGKMIDAALGR